ncbi:hypothetical protein OUZ56_018689 [Daphnia magna]|uniref:Uncharacterized protein n=1 Tax=Daphnia magna TaxID=35525 RepID=A0ABQ9Z9G1_9CRUS|nr:hypothetical protein OUZ56_018649 [Daphnia magna]KAK4009555.1 hypothetical protein OUZ56_018689 [Daphnia magna]
MAHCSNFNDWSISKVAANMGSPSVSVMQMLLFCIRIVWSMMYSNSDLDGRGSYFASWLWAIIELLLSGSIRQVRQRDSNHFVSYWYDVLIGFVKKRYFDLSAGVVETAEVAVKLSPVGPTCMLLSPHFLSLTIRQHSRWVINIVSYEYTVSKDPIKNDLVIFFVLVHCLHVHPFQVAAVVRRFEVQYSSNFHIVTITDGCVDRSLRRLCAGSRN